MTITYTWTITGLDCADPDADVDCDTIKSANWTLSGTDGNDSSFISGKTLLNITMDVEGQTTADTFAAVTEADIIAAVQTVMGTENVNNMKINIANNIILLSASVYNTPALPWVV